VTADPLFVAPLAVAAGLIPKPSPGDGQRSSPIMRNR
jgi:hypothetical protein